MPAVENKNITGQVEGKDSEALDIKDKAVADFKGFLTALYPYLKLTYEMCLKNLVKKVMSLILKHMDTACNDEKIFECYDGIMDNYCNIVNEFNACLADINDLRIREILGGICSILSAQAKQHEEYCSQKTGERLFKNPIRAEKEQVINELYDSVYKPLKGVNIDGYFKSGEIEDICFRTGRKDAKEAHLHCYEHIYKTIIEKNGSGIYKNYCSVLSDRIAGLNILDTRNVTGYYYESLKQEKENLDSIVNIQVLALLEKIGLGGISETEKGAVEKITGAIIKTYEQINAGSKEIEMVLKDISVAGKKTETLSQDAFIKNISEFGSEAQIEALKRDGPEAGTMSAVVDWTNKLNGFIADFNLLTKGAAIKTKEATAKPYTLFLYNTRKSVTDKLLLTEEMVAGFKKLNEFYQENEEQIKLCGQVEIINGIHESIELKLEILMESKEDFENSVKQKLTAFMPPDLTDEDLCLLINDWLEIWYKKMISLDIYDIDYREKATRNIQAIFEEIEHNADTYDYDDKIKSKIEKETDAIKKMEANYLKDFVLFEVGTFEEILAYSVSKIKESGDEVAIQYASVCEGINTFLIELLKRHGIDVISPEPYSAFNSSEHEVLVAEKNENYKKGQIIKLMNCGFKYNGLVLVRANVIAAR